MAQKKSFTLNKNKFEKTPRWAKFLMALGLIGFILLLILFNINPVDENQSKKALDNRNVLYDSAIKCKTTTNCKVQCENGIVSNIINDFINNNITNCTSIDLDLIRCFFLDELISKYWIQSNIAISRMKIENCFFKNIDSEAFNTKAFLTSLKELSISVNNIQQIDFDGFLEPLGKTLSSFQIGNLKYLTNPQIILGHSSLSCQIVDLRYNNFGDLINETTFDALVGVVSLYLSESQITAIGARTFDKISKTLRRLELKDNFLKKLPSCLFDKLLLGKIDIILLEDNQWNCSCELKYMTEVYTNYSKIFQDNLKCATPKKYNGAKINETDIKSSCPIKNSDSESKDEDIGQPATITGENNLPCSSLVRNNDITNDCWDPNNNNDTKIKEHIKVLCNLCDNERCDIGENLHDEYLYLKGKDVDFKIESVSTGIVKISIDSSRLEYAVIWFNSAVKNFLLMETNYKDYGLGCQKPYQHYAEFTIGNLTVFSSYTFCLIKIGDISISPFNCHSHYIQDENHGWIAKNFQAIIIIFLIVGVILAVIFGALIMFCIVRCNPTLLKGSKRVIVVNKSTTDVMVLPRNSSTSTDITTTNTTVTCHSRSTIPRKLSDSSINSGRSYVIPNTYEVIQNERTEALKREKIYFEKFPDNSPPPLPKRLSTDLNNSDDTFLHFSNIFFPKIDSPNYIESNKC